MANDAGFLDDPALLEAFTRRARCAYYLVVAEAAFAAMSSRDPGFPHAREALDMAWQWVAGEQIAADDLYLKLENEDGSGLMRFGYEARNEPSRSAVWNTLITAIMYVIWQAYRADGAAYVPQTIESVDETIIADLHRHAEHTGRFDQQQARRILDYLQANFTTSTSDELGGAIQRSDVMNATA
jgi:hypothetical protein